MDWLVPAGARVVVDLAAGTGLLTRALAQRVSKVIAVEPDERMAAVLRANTPDVEVVQGVGESIPLPAASTDGLFISSAFHWMDPERAVPEIGRVLRDGGRFGMIWTSRDRETGWVRDMDAFRANFTERDRAEQPRRRNRHVELPPGSPFTEAEIESFTYTRTMPTEDVVAMMATYSGVITASPADRQDVLDRLRAELAEHFPGAAEVDVPIRSLCWRTTRLPR